QLRINQRQFEFQMLYGMADSIKSAVVQLGCRLREYCPVGELLPGMAYLVRRLLENTSNEGFLASKFAKGSTRDELLRNPADLNTTSGTIEPLSKPTLFQNEPLKDFTIAEERERMSKAIRDLRPKLGKRHSLIINNKPAATQDWLPSLNPANQ